MTRGPSPATPPAPVQAGRRPVPVQALALTLIAVVGAIAVAALGRAGRDRRDGPAQGLSGERRPAAFKALSVGTLGAAVILEAWGLWVSLRAYAHDFPAAVDVTAAIGVLTLVANVTYVVWLRTRHRFEWRRRRLTTPLE